MADNFQGTGFGGAAVTMASKDLGSGVQLQKIQNTDSSGAEILAATSTLQTAANALATTANGLLTTMNAVLAALAIKGASTTALATDPSLVVQLSPNGAPSNGQNNVAGSRTFNSASDDVNIGPHVAVAGVSLTVAGDFLGETDVSAYEAMYVHITGSAASFNVGITGGNVSGSLTAVPGQSVGQETSAGPSANITSNQLVFVPLGFKLARVSLTAIASGTCTVTISLCKRAVVVPSFPQTITPNSVVSTGPANNARGQNSAASTSPAVLKSAAAILNAGTISNKGAAGAYVHLYNKASAPVPGTDTPVFSFYLGPAMLTPFAIPCGPFGRRFSNGIGIAMTTDFAATAGGTITNAGEVTYEINW